MEIESLDENAAWHKVFTSGSEELKSKLKKVHAKNPKFQAFLKSIGHEGEQKSAAQAKKDVAVINKAKAKAAEPKPVDRLTMIKQAAEKRKARAQVAKHRANWGGEVPGARYDDPIASARAGIPIRGYRLGEEKTEKEKRISALKLKLIKVAANRGKSREATTAYDDSAPHKQNRGSAAGYAADLRRDLASKYTKQFAEEHRPLLPAQEKIRKDLIDKELAAKREKRQAGTSYGKYLAAAKNKKLEEGKMKDIVTDRMETERLANLNAKKPAPAGKDIARTAIKNLLTQRKGK